MAGRPRGSKTSDYIEILQLQKDRIIINNKIVPKSNVVWLDLIKKYHIKISLNSFYAYAHRYKHLLGVTGECEVSDTSTNKNLSDYSCSEDDYVDEINNSKLTSNMRYFDIYINSKQWLDISPELKIYKRTSGSTKNYFKLKAYVWTDVLATAVWKSTKLPCSWCFYYNYISLTNEVKYFLKFKASCKECLAVLFGFVYQSDNLKPEENGLTIACSVKGLKDYQHKKKRRLANIRREKACAEMITGKMASALRKRESAQLNLDLFDEESPLLPRLETYRKAKSNRLLKNRIHQDPIEALAIAASNMPFKNIVHEIGKYKFFVHYWSPDQTRVYNQYCKQNLFPTVYIDSTGGVVRKIVHSGLEKGYLSSHIFFYAIVIKLGRESEGQIPVAQMLSERNNASAIAYWLSEWRRLGARHPKEIICDDSNALLLAISRSFAGEADTHSYLKKCFEVLQDKPGCQLPKSFIRIDVAHLIKAVSTWSILKNVRHRIKSFYLRCIGQLILATDLSDAQMLLKYIFVVALSEYEGVSVKLNRNHICEVYKSKLIDKFSFGLQQSEIVNFPDNEASMDGLENKNDIDDIDDNEQLAPFKSFVLNIIKNAEGEVNENGEGSRDNIMWLPGIINPLKILCYKLPLWTSVMVNKFNFGNITASSASVESHFNDLKTRLMPKLPLRADEFVLEHCSILEGTMKLASGLPSLRESYTSTTTVEHQKSIMEETNTVIDETEVLVNKDIEAKELNYVENWRGLNEESKKMRKSASKKKPSLYLNPERPWSTMDSSDIRDVNKKVSINILKNGGQIHCPALRGKTTISLSNTCAFDSLLHGIACALYDSKSLKNCLFPSNIQIFNLALMMAKKNVTYTIYRERANILKDIFHAEPCPSVLLDIVRVSCETTVHNLIKKLGIISLTETSNCKISDCNHLKESPLLSLTLENTTDLQKSLVELQNVKTKCEHLVEFTNVCSDIIFLDIFTERVDENGIEILHTTTLDNIPKSVNFYNKTFSLRAVIAFLPPLFSITSGIGHFVTYARRSDYSWEKFDDTAQKTEILNKNAIITDKIKLSVLIYSI